MSIVYDWNPEQGNVERILTRNLFCKHMGSARDTIGIFKARPLSIFPGNPFGERELDLDYGPSGRIYTNTIYLSLLRDLGRIQLKQKYDSKNTLNTLNDTYVNASRAYHKGVENGYIASSQTGVLPWYELLITEREMAFTKLKRMAERSESKRLQDSFDFVDAKNRERSTSEKAKIMETLGLE